jgi:hypothetical protein
MKTRSKRISRPGGRSGVRLVADANVLLSAVLGGRARLILTSPRVEAAYTTASILDEVLEFCWL